MKKKHLASHKIPFCDSIGVISANLWHDWPRFRLMPERLEAFACLVEDKNADILLLQEVTRKPDLRVDEWLAKRLRMDYVYSRANGHSRIGFEEGVAIYSRFPLHSPNLLQLGKPGSLFVRRMGVSALVDTPCGSLHAFSVHLGIQKRDNARQISHLHHWVRQSAPHMDAVIGGDFNAHETSPLIKQTSSVWVDTYRQVNPTKDGHTHSLHWPWGGVMVRHRLDYIFLKSEMSDWQVADTQHMTTPGLAHSDHRLVYTRLVPARVIHQN